MKSTREANKCTGKIFRGGIFDKGMADVLRTLVVLLLCALCLGSCAREGDKGEGDKGEGLMVNGSYLAGSDDRQSRAGLTVKDSEAQQVVKSSEEAQQVVKSEKSDGQESSTVSRSMQESTETVAKTYGYFSENGGSEKNQNRSSVSGVSAAKEAPQTSDISQQTSDINHQPSDINPQPSTLSHQTSDVNHHTSDAVAADPEEPKAEVILPPVLIDNHPGTEENVAESASSQPSDISHHTSIINHHTSDINPQSSDSTQQNSEPKPVVALRTNLLYDAALVPNIGVEVGLGKGFTLAADWFGTWLFSDKNHWYWQGYGGYLTARYYFDKDNPQYSLTPGQMLSSGHHVGIYGTALTYDVEFGGIGYQAAQFGFGGGVEYGYSLKVAQSLCIDFNLGLGYQGGEYKKYMPTDDGSGHYVWMSTHRRHWWGPTKAEISLKWLITPTKKKGGEL